MIGVDTNVLIRYLAQDDPVQSALAGEFLESELGRAKPGFVPAIVLCETAWVLSSAYGVSRADLAHILEQILRTESLEHEHDEAALLALEEFRVTKLDFADCLIAQICMLSGCSEIATFDGEFAKRPSVRRLG